MGRGRHHLLLSSVTIHTSLTSHTSHTSSRFLSQHKAHTDLLSSLDGDLAQLSRIGLHPALRVR